jgi:phage shock protein C
MGGLGTYLNIDPNLLRLTCVAFLVPTGLFILPAIYFIAGFIIPEGPKNYLQPRYKALYRSNTDRKLGGIIGGLAEYFSIDSNLLRLLYIIATIITAIFPLLITYIVGLIIIPEKPRA